jgi:predicted  nucleic acid-binding Zn-ribbon protein
MAAGDYLRSAAASLHQAANHLQQQARELRDQIIRTQRDKQALIDHNKNEIKTKQVEQSAIDDVAHQSRLAREIDKLQHEIISAEQEMRQARDQLQRAADAKLNTSTALASQAQQLADRSSAPELNS